MSRQEPPEEPKTQIEARPGDTQAESVEAADAEIGPDEESLPERIGVYEIVEEIGRGGMGCVYKAIQTDLGRTVALKALPLPHNLPADYRRELIARFGREVSMTSRLRHPSIIPVFDYGQEGTVRYFTMPYIEGVSLSDHVAKKGPHDPRAAFELIRPIAQALAHAHGKGMIHRDLKPNNILIDGEGNPMLLDFGLVKLMAGPTDLTSAGVILGTPQFMSPEQASGYPDQVDAQSDIYSLGAVLFYILTGHPPFDGNSTIDVLTKIANQPIPDPSQLNPRVDPEARKVVLKALAKDKAQRYRSAGRFHRDVNRYLRGRPIRTRLEPGRPVRRPLWPPLVAGVVLACLSIGLALHLTASPARPEALTLGVAPFEARERMASAYEAFAAQLSIDLERPVEYRIASGYEDLLAQITGGDLDLAVLSSYNYVRATRDADRRARILATFSAFGRSHYQGIILVRRDRGIENLLDLEGRTFGYVDKNSASGYIFPRALLLSQGLAPDTFLGEARLLGSHSRVRKAVLEGEVDAGATYLQAEYDEDLRILARTEPIPFDAFVTRPDLDPDLARRVRDSLLAIDAYDETGRAIASLYSGFDGWRVAVDADYDYVRQLIRLKSDPVRIAVLPLAGAPPEPAAALAGRLQRAPQCDLIRQAEVALRTGDAVDAGAVPPAKAEVGIVLRAAGLEYLVLVGPDEVQLWRTEDGSVDQVLEIQGPPSDETLRRIQVAIPVYGFVAAVDGETVTVNVGTADGLAVGQRLIVFHYQVQQDPLTGQVLGRSEVRVGRVEVVEAGEDRSTARIVEGLDKIAYGKRVRSETIRRVDPH